MPREVAGAGTAAERLRRVDEMVFFERGRGTIAVIMRRIGRLGGRLVVESCAGIRGGLNGVMIHHGPVPA